MHRGGYGFISHVKLTHWFCGPGRMSAGAPCGLNSAPPNPTRSGDGANHDSLIIVIFAPDLEKNIKDQHGNRENDWDRSSDFHCID